MSSVHQHRVQFFFFITGNCYLGVLSSPGFGAEFAFSLFPCFACRLVGRGLVVFSLGFRVS